MKREDIETLADAQQYITERTPEPVKKWYGLRCPRCGRRFHNSLYGTWMAYDVHYAEHVIGEMHE